MLIELLSDWWYVGVIFAILMVGEYCQHKKTQKISDMLDGENVDWP